MSYVIATSAALLHGDLIIDDVSSPASAHVLLRTTASAKRARRFLDGLIMLMRLKREIQLSVFAAADHTHCGCGTPCSIPGCAKFQMM